MQQIVIVGGGFAGFWAAMGAARVRAEAGAEFAIALVSRDPRMVLRPRLYEQAPDRLSVELPPLLAAVDVGFTLGEVAGLGEDAVILADGRRLPFDRLVLAAGSVARRPEIPDFAAHGLMLDTLADAERLQRHLAARKPGETVVVIGAGFTGVEIAAELGPRFRVVLVERAAQLAAALGDGPRPAITGALDSLGVETRLGCDVTAVTAEEVTLSTGQRITTRTAIWAGGLAASPLTDQIDAPRDAAGRFMVDPFLGVPGHPALFAAGDVASATAVEGHQTLMSCQHAMPLGRVAGHNAARHLLGLEMAPFSAPAYVTCLDLGDAGAMLSVGWDRRVVRTGDEAKIVKRTINGLRILPPPAEREALLAAAGLNTGRPPTEAGMLAYFDQLIASQRGAA